MIHRRRFVFDAERTFGYKQTELLSKKGHTYLSCNDAKKRKLESIPFVLGLHVRRLYAHNILVQRRQSVHSDQRLLLLTDWAQHAHSLTVQSAQNAYYVPSLYRVYEWLKLKVQHSCPTTANKYMYMPCAGISEYPKVVDIALHKNKMQSWIKDWFS